VVIGGKIRNEGDLRVASIPVQFEGIWEGAGVTELLTDSEGNPLEVLISQTLEPGGSVFFQVEYDKDDNDRGTFPDRVRVIVDPGAGDGVARECNEKNNSAAADVDAPPPLPDLRVVLDNPSKDCPPPVSGKVFNDTAVAATGVVVRIYAGDPSTGANAIGDVKIGTVEAGESVDFEQTLEGFPTRSPIRLYGEVDPDGVIEECNESNNDAGPTALTSCQQVL